MSDMSSSQRAAAATPSSRPKREDSGRHAGARHHPIVRLTHWVSALALVVMAGSGLRIFNASPQFAPKGHTFAWWPWEGTAVPANLTFGGWLGGARHWHFAMMWLLVVNALVYLGYLFLKGEWRELTPRRGSIRDAIAMAAFYLGRTRTHPVQGKHNALQKYAYSSMIVLGMVSVISGIAIWKPVSLGWLAAAMGGYHLARWWHFTAMLALGVLVVVHVVMVFAVDPYALRAMTTGGYDDERFSPEARNARPFVNLAPAKIEEPS
ncbi:MAG: cytochrome b/b6 domain-containing protein [Gemmatimonadaceae bacterium]|nr:cytochrome b/b6 domain-containing protein [Gemmatimonadaceae bacterium]